MRTTIDIDDPVLAELKRLQKHDGRTLGRLMSDLLLQALALQTSVAPPPAPTWAAQAMGAKLNLSDREALLDAMDDSRNLSTGGS